MCTKITLSILALFLITTKYYAQTSCGTVTSFNYTTTPINATHSTFDVTINFTNSTSTRKGIAYSVMCGNIQMANNTCFQTDGGTNTSTIHSFTAPTGDLITVPWVGYTASNGNCGGGTCGEITDAVLPIKLKSLQAHTNKNGNVIVWEVENENVNDTYIVQKSKDAANWVSLEKVSQKNNIRNQYSVVDRQPNLNTFYRVANYDFEGKLSFSQIIEVKNKIIESEIHIVNNPVADQLKINLPSFDGSQKTEIQIVNLNGMLVYEGTHKDDQINIDVESLIPSIYFARIQFNGDIIVKKFTKI